MTLKDKIKNTIATGTLLIGSLFGGAVIAEEPQTLPDIRLRSESNLREGEDSHKFTFGLADSTDGKRGEEYLRGYQYFGSQDYTALSLSLPSFNVGDLKNSARVFGTFGAKEGIGLASTHVFGDLTGTLNLEKSFTDSASRIGAGLDYKFGRWTIGTAFDTKDAINGRTNQYLVHGIFDASEKDQLGLGYVLSDTEGTKTNSLAGFWCHMDDSWGTRSRVRYDWNNQGNKSIGFDSIIAQNPTFSRFSSPWIVSRGIGDMYDLGVVKDALGPERVPLGDRTKGGLVGELQGSFNLNGNSGFLKGEAGYKFAKNSWDITPTVFYQHNFEGNDQAGASVLTNLGKVLGGNVCVEGTYTKEFRGDDDFYVGVQWSCPIGGQRR